MLCFFVGQDELWSSQSADKDEMLKHYLQLAKEASEEKDVLLYFDETVLEKMNDISDISSKITLVGATNSSASLDNQLLSKVSKYIHISPPNLTTRLRFINKQIEEAGYTNDMGEKEMEFIGRETENFSFRDLQRLWYQSCDILLSQLRQADHFKKSGDEFRCFVPCNCKGGCDRFEKKDVISDAIEMRVTFDTMIRALSVASITVHDKIIGEEEYLKKYSEFVENPEGKDANADESDKNKIEGDDDDDEACMRIGGCVFTLLAFVIGMIVLLSVKKPNYHND